METNLNIKWSEFMEKNDMVWDRMPFSWDEGAFMGNGTLGSLVYIDEKKKLLKLDIGSNEAYDYRVPSSYGVDGKYDNPRLPIGAFYLKTKGEIIDFKMRLDLYNAETQGTIKTNCGEVKFQTIVHSDEMLILFKTVSSGDEIVNWEFIPAISRSPRQEYGIQKNDSTKFRLDYVDNPPAVQFKEKGIFISKQQLMSGGEISVFYNETHQQNDKTLYVNINSSLAPSNVTIEGIEYLSNKINYHYDTYLKSHKKWWNGYYPISFITLPDKRLEAFYYIQMYKLASATRSGRGIIDNQGPWLTPTAWPGTWWNLNVELSYWPLYTSNRLELSKSLWQTLQKYSDDLINSIDERYRHDSAGIGTSTTTGLVSKVAVPEEDNGNIFHELGNLTWVLHNCFLYYKMIMDDKYLSDFLFPLLKRSINYYRHFLNKESDQKYHLKATASPEYGICEQGDANYDLSLIIWGCQTLLYCNDHLGLNDELVLIWKEIVDNLTPFPQDENGFMIGRNKPYNKSHRHYSHLLMIYPLYLINRDNEKMIPLIEKSLSHWQSKKEKLLGYSCTGAASISAAINKGDQALDYLNRLWSDFLRPNTMYKESGPVIETPLSAAQSIHDFLIQSWGSKIRIFPAVPSSWKDVAFHNLRAEGNFEVSAIQKNGETKWVRIISHVSKQCVVKVTFNHDIKFISNKTIKWKQVASDEYSIHLYIDEEVIISVADNDDFDITESDCAFGCKNYYGLNQNNQPL